LVENSNFVQPHKLINHRRYTFINGGKDGQGFSEPTYVEGIEILKEIEAIFVEGSKSDTNTIFIYSLASAIREVIRTYEQGIAKIYYAIMKKVEFSHELERSLAEILAFVWLTNITWTIGMLGGKFVVP
jgi:hypothetical protein